MKVKVLSLVCGLFITSCGKKDSKSDPVENRDESQTNLLDRKLDLPSLSSTPWESRCVAVENFVDRYVETYLENVKVKALDGCNTRPFGKQVSYTYSVAVSRGSESLNLEFRVYSELSANAGYIERQEGIASENYFYKEEDEKIGEGLKVLSESFQGWLKGDNSKATIYGKSYKEFSIGLVDDLSLGKVLIEDPILEVKLVPNEESKLRGEFQFTNVDESYFVRGTYLGCTQEQGLECINADLKYTIVGPYIVIERNVEGTNQSFGAYFKVMDDSNT